MKALTIDREAAAGDSRRPALVLLRSLGAVIVAGLAILVLLPAAIAAQAASAS